MSFPSEDIRHRTEPCTEPRPPDRRRYENRNQSYNVTQYEDFNPSLKPRFVGRDGKNINKVNKKFEADGISFNFPYLGQETVEEVGKIKVNVKLSRNNRSNERNRESFLSDYQTDIEIGQKLEKAREFLIDWQNRNSPHENKLSENESDNIRNRYPSYKNQNPNFKSTAGRYNHRAANSPSNCLQTIKNFRNHKTDNKILHCQISNTFQKDHTYLYKTKLFQQIGHDREDENESLDNNLISNTSSSPSIPSSDENVNQIKPKRNRHLAEANPYMNNKINAFDKFKIKENISDCGNCSFQSSVNFIGVKQLYVNYEQNKEFNPKYGQKEKLYLPYNKFFQSSFIGSCTKEIRKSHGFEVPVPKLYFPLKTNMDGFAYLRKPFQNSMTVESMKNGDERACNNPRLTLKDIEKVVRLFKMPALGNACEVERGIPSNDLFDIIMTDTVLENLLNAKLDEPIFFHIYYDKYRDKNGNYNIRPILLLDKKFNSEKSHIQKEFSRFILDENDMSEESGTKDKNFFFYKLNPNIFKSYWPRNMSILVCTDRILSRTLIDESSSNLTFGDTSKCKHIDDKDLFDKYYVDSSNSESSSHSLSKNSRKEKQKEKRPKTITNLEYNKNIHPKGQAFSISRLFRHNPSPQEKQIAQLVDKYVLCADYSLTGEVAMISDGNNTSRKGQNLPDTQDIYASPHIKNDRRKNHTILDIDRKPIPLFRHNDSNNNTKRYYFDKNLTLPCKYFNFYEILKILSDLRVSDRLLKSIEDQLSTKKTKSKQSKQSKQAIQVEKPNIYGIFFLKSKSVLKQPLLADPARNADCSNKYDENKCLFEDLSASSCLDYDLNIELFDRGDEFWVDNPTAIFDFGIGKGRVGESQSGGNREKRVDKEKKETLIDSDW